MTRRGTTGIAWLIGLMAMLASSVAEPAARLLESHDADDQRQESVQEAAGRGGSAPSCEWSRHG